MKAEWIALALKAACLAGRRIMELYATDFEIEHKSDRSPVTVADRQAHAVIRSVLADSALPVLSEEGRDIPYTERKKWHYFWLVDPLDGTKEFIKRNGEFTVNIALMDVDRPVAGIVYAPVLDLLYYGKVGGGAYRIDARTLGAGCEPMDAARLEALIGSARRLPEKPSPRPFTIAGSRSHATQDLHDYVAQLRSAKSVVDVISAGSSLKFCLVAEGKADQYPRLGPTMEWDTAAGQAVAEAAGATVQRFGSRTPLQYNKESLLNPWFVVAWPEAGMDQRP